MAAVQYVAWTGSFGVYASHVCVGEQKREQMLDQLYVVDAPYPAEWATEASWYMSNVLVWHVEPLIACWADVKHSAEASTVAVEPGWGWCRSSGVAIYACVYNGHVWSESEEKMLLDGGWYNRSEKYRLCLCVCVPVCKVVQSGVFSVHLD